MQDSTNNQTSGHTFAEVISDKKLIEKLEGLGLNQAATLQIDALKAVQSGKNIRIEASRDAALTLLCGLASNVADLQGKKALFLTSPANISSASTALKSIGLSLALVEDSGNVSSADGFSALAKAAIVAGTPKAISQALAARSMSASDFSLLICESLDVPPSAPESDRIASGDVTAILEAFAEVNPLQKVWIAQSIPLAFVSQVKRFFFTEDAELISGSLHSHSAGSGSGADLQHVYYEVGSELTAKPQALCDIIEAHPGSTAAVFCNSPSDADLVEVFLQRRGISTEKLIGHVPAGKVLGAMDRAKEGQVTALVITDVAARHLRVEDMDMVINHSIPSDPEVYIDRVGRIEDGGKLSKVISIVGPTDVGNFHYLKKLVDFSFQKAELPSAADMLEVKFSRLLEATQGSELGLSSQYEELSDKILASDKIKSILAYLLHSTLEVLPEAQSKGRRNGNKRSRDRDEERDDSRNQRDSHSRGDRRDREDRGGDREDRRQPRTPPKKDIRIYVGHGLDQGFSEERFSKLLDSLGEEQLPRPKRVSVREHYSFIDYAEESADSVLEKLSSAELDKGEKFIAYRAAVINVPREDDPSEGADAEEGFSSESAAIAESNEGAEQSPEGSEASAGV